MSDKTPRQAFVEAMRSIEFAHNRPEAAEGCEACVTAAQAACDAFADQECACIHDCCFDCAGHKDDLHRYNFGISDHAECRASLRKEIGL